MTTTQRPRISEREAILTALSAWVRQRPGLDPRDYGGGMDGYRTYQSEVRSITRDLHDALTLLADVGHREHSVTADMLRDAFRAFSGRLSWVYDAETGQGTLDYCTGQYWPAEYRKAACAVLASAVWSANRTAWPKDDGHGLRKRLRAQFGRGIQSRWFS